MLLSKLILKMHLNKAVRQGLILGKNCYIHSRIDFGSEPFLIRIGDNVRIASGVKFITHDGGAWVIRNMNNCMSQVDVFGQIIIQNNVHIGANAIIMPGVEIGCNCVVACGAVVTKSIPANSVVAGVPARVIESIEEYELKVKVKGINTHSLSRKEKKDKLLGIYNNVKPKE